MHLRANCISDIGVNMASFASQARARQLEKNILEKFQYPSWSLRIKLKCQLSLRWILKKWEKATRIRMPF